MFKNPAARRTLLLCVTLLVPLFANQLNASAAAPTRNDRPQCDSPASEFFRQQYHVADDSFCNSMACVDFDNDGRRELLLASRRTSELQMLRASDGSVVWSKQLAGDQQSLSAYDLDDDGDFEILYTVSGPGRLYVLDHTGRVLRQSDSGDWKLGNSAVIADVDGDGEVEIVGMTFGCEVYCLDSRGRIRWQKDLRPNLDDDAHAYLTPILCDVSGDERLEILALTNAQYFDDNSESKPEANGVVFAMSADGAILDRYDVGGPRYWGDAFVSNVDDDPLMELVISGSGGLDVIETRGYGPDTEHFQRRRSYQRLNVVPWAYHDSYFIYRGDKDGVVNRTDDLVLARQAGRHQRSGKFTTALLAPPPGAYFDRITFDAHSPAGTAVRLAVLDASGKLVQDGVQDGAELNLAQPVRLQFQLSTDDPLNSPSLDAYRLAFRRRLSARQLILEVDAGEADREGTPVSFPLPESLGHYGNFTLTRLDDDAAVDVQRDAQQLVWLLGDKLPAGQTRRYRLTAATARDDAASEQTPKVTCQDDGKRLVVKVGGQAVLHYNHAVVASPDPEKPYYARSGYIHPVFTPAGKQVTDDFAPDHPHQHGIMFAWTDTTYEGRAVNFWDQMGETGRVEHAKVESVTSGSVFGGFTSVIRHSDLTAPGGPKPVLSETWNVRVFHGDDGFLFDLHSEQSLVGASPLRINKYHYGGLAIRGHRQWLEPGAGDFLTSEGKTRADGNHSRPRWCDMHGKIDSGACGVTIFSHPENFRFPQHVRLHPEKPYFCYSPMVLSEFEISPQQPYRSRFRYLVHDGPVDRERADRAWFDFAHPPVVRIAGGEQGKR